MRLIHAFLAAVAFGLSVSSCSEGSGTVSAATTITRTNDGIGTSSTTGVVLPVAVSVDDLPVALRKVCMGADGAVVATDYAGRRIILVREKGPALRIEPEGGPRVETTVVKTIPTGRSTRFEAVILVESRPTRVTMEIINGAALRPC